MSNECPKCGDAAMDPMAKIMKRPFICQGCGQELRMNLIFSGVLSLIYFFLVIKIFLNNGASGSAMLYVLIATGVFVGACLFIPLEEKN